MGACELESGDVALATIPIRKMTIGIAQPLRLIIEWRTTMPKRRPAGDRSELKPVNIGAAAIDIGSNGAHGCGEPRLHRRTCAVFSAHSRKTCMSWRTGSKRAA